MKILLAASLTAAAALAVLNPSRGMAQSELSAVASPRTAPHAETRAIPVRQLIGESVMNEDGEKLGEVTRVLSAGGETYFLAVSDGGFLGIGTKTAALAVPRMQVANDGTLVMPGMTKEQFDTMTDIIEGRLPTAASDAVVPVPVD